MEGATLDQHCSSAPPSRQPFPAFVLSGPHGSTPGHQLHPFLCSSLTCCYTRLHKDPWCVWNGCCKVFFVPVLLLNLDLSMSPHPPPSTVLLSRRWWHFHCLSQSVMILTSSLQFSRGIGRSQNVKLLPVHKLALDDYHGKVTTGWGICNLSVESNHKPTFFSRKASGSLFLIDCHLFSWGTQQGRCAIWGHFEVFCNVGDELWQSISYACVPASLCGSFSQVLLCETRSKTCLFSTDCLFTIWTPVVGELTCWC